MKKLLVFTLLLALLACPMGMAEEATETQSEATFLTYTDETNAYTISYPDTWMPMTEDMLDTIINYVTTTGIEGIDTDTINQYMETAKNANMFMAFSPDFTTNFNVLSQQTGMAMDAQSLAAILPSIMSQYQALYGDSVTRVDTDEIVTMGDNEFVCLAITYDLNGTLAYLLQYFICPNENMYCITTTFPYDDTTAYDTYIADIEAIAASFAVK